MNSLSLVKKIHHYLEKKGSFFYSRRKAHRLRGQLMQKRGYKIVDRKRIRVLKDYAKETFGSASFWPWLAFYTELRGEFKTGWIPLDYFTVYILKKYNPESIRISDYKTLDNKIFPDFAFPPLFIKIGENFYDSKRKQITAEEAEDLLFNYNDEVVLKEDLGMGGNKIAFINSKNFKCDNYSHILSYTVQPVINQHEILKSVNAKSVNTVRVSTFQNRKGDIEVKYSFLRFGLGDSRVDNVSSGGGFCFINSEGRLGDIAYNKLGMEIGSKHPENGTLFRSLVIPNYQKVLRKCVNSHKTFPYVKFIGWDVAIKQSGEPVLLEWNLRPALWMPEALCGPFFEEEL